MYGVVRTPVGLGGHVCKRALPGADQVVRSGWPIKRAGRGMSGLYQIKS